MIDYQAIINHYYEEDTPLRHILLVHSRAVADKALRICDRHPELGLDREFIEAAAMLHDIGIRECNAPGIHCHGTRPYIQHGLAGAEMILGVQSSKFKVYSSRFIVQGSRGQGWEAIARICQRHTGAGITRAEVLAQGLPLPLPDDGSEPYMPETLEEQVVCYADKFFSKTKLEREKTIAEAEHSLEKFGKAGVERFRHWVEMFE